MGKTRIKNREREDFSELLKNIHKHIDETSTQVKGTNDANLEIDKNLQRILSDEMILYLHQKSTNIIHDKHCKYAQSLVFEDVDGLQEYDFQIKQCPHCAIRAYLRIGAEDYSRYRKYEELFEKMKVDIVFVRKLYVDMCCKTNICDSGDTIHILHGEEGWKIKLINSAKGRVRLSHNDYRLSYYGEYKRFNTYHIQSKGCEDTTADYALEVIARHKKHRAYCEYPIEEQQVIRLLKFNSAEKLEDMADMLGVSVFTISDIMKSLIASETIVKMDENGTSWRVTM